MKPILFFLVLAFATCVSGIDGAMVMDDENAILENGTIRNLADLTTVLFPPSRLGSTTDGRPLLNLSFALNYALHRDHVRGYRIVNAGIHWLNCILLFQILWQLFASPRVMAALRDRSRPAAMLATAVWAVQPIHCSVTTYICQRAESMSVCCALALIAIWISRLPLRSRLIGCVVTFTFGTLTKETVWTAPLIAIVLQRWQFGLTWREWWAKDRGLVLAIATSAIPVIAYMTKHGGRSGTVAAGSSESFDYLVHQGWVIPRYLWTWICPTAACVDYGPFYPGTSSLAWLGAGVLSILFIGSMILSIKGRGIGVPLLCAFLYLAPSSSFIPVLTQVGGEQRFYLPGVVVVIYGVLSWSWVIERMRDQRIRKQFSLGVSVATGLLILIYISVSWQLNRSFATPKSFWNFVVAQAPHNLRARSNSARLAYQDLGIEKAIEQWLVPLENQPSLHIPARLEAAELLLQTGGVDAAARSLIAIIREDPTNIDAHVLYSRALIDSALYSEAIRVLAEVERQEPWRDDAWSEHGRCLRLISASTSKPDQMESLPQIESESEKLFLHALEINSANFEARFNLASLLLDQGRNTEALQEFRACLIYKANNPVVWHWLAQLYDHFGKAGESEYAAAESAYWQNR